MADGDRSNDGGSDGGSTTEEIDADGLAWFDLGTRAGILRTTAFAGTTVLVLVLLLNFSPTWGLQLIDQPFLDTSPDWLWLSAATAVVWLPLVLLLLDSEDNMATGPSLGVPLITLGLLAMLAAGSAALKYSPGLLDAASTGLASPASIASPVMAVFFFLLAAVLIPRIWNAALFAQFAEQQFRARQAELQRGSTGSEPSARELARKVGAHNKEQGNAEAISALFATFVVFGVGLLAYVAGGWTPETRIDGGVGLVIATSILGIFAVVILLDWLAELPFIRRLGRLMNWLSFAFGWLAAFYNFVDMLLVRIGSHVAGAAHVGSWARYGVLAGTQVCLAIMSWCLPDPLGLIPGLIGVVLAISVSRLWAWVEEDRNLALMTRFNANTPRRIGFKEDYRDEAIFSFLFLLALIPIALKQADAGRLFGMTYFDNADHSSPLPWIIYICFELAKALPIVDWADIYLDPSNFETLKPLDPTGQHATFFARAMVDLLLVAGLLQAVSIILRNRQQKALYRGEQIDRLDEIVEREELKRAVARGEANWFNGPINFRRYNEERLREIYVGESDPERRRFIEKVFDARHANIGTPMDTLEQVAKKRPPPAAELEQVFAAVCEQHDKGVNRLGPLDLREILDALRAEAGLKDFKFRVLDFAERIGFREQTGSPTELARMLRFTIYGSRRDQYLYTRKQAAQILLHLIPHLPDEPEGGPPDTEPDPTGALPLVTALIRDHVGADQSIFGAAKKLSADIEAALRKRLQELNSRAL